MMASVKDDKMRLLADVRKLTEARKKKLKEQAAKKDTRVRRADVPLMNRGAAATWTFRGVAAPPRRE